MGRFDRYIYPFAFLCENKRIDLVILHQSNQSIIMNKSSKVNSERGHVTVYQEGQSKGMTKTALKDWMPIKNTRSPTQGFPPCLVSTRHGYLSLISAGIDHDPSAVFPTHMKLSFLLFELGWYFLFCRSCSYSDMPNV